MNILPLILIAVAMLSALAVWLHFWNKGSVDRRVERDLKEWMKDQKRNGSIPHDEDY